MTDEEIEKALKCCATDYDGEKCGKCTNKSSCQYNKESNLTAVNELCDDALNYINRLKAEKAQVRKDTAKEILVKWWKENIATGNECGNDYVDELVLDYGLDYDDFRTSIEVDDE